MNSPHDLRTDSESDRKPDSALGSNERTNERTNASDRNGRQSGAGSRRERAYDEIDRLTPEEHRSERAARRAATYREQIAELRRIKDEATGAAAEPTTEKPTLPPNVHAEAARAAMTTAAADTTTPQEDA